VNTNVKEWPKYANLGLGYALGYAVGYANNGLKKTKCLSSIFIGYSNLAPKKAYKWGEATKNGVKCAVLGVIIGGKYTGKGA